MDINVNLIHTNWRDKFFLNGDFSYERKKVQRWYMLYGKKIIDKCRKNTPSDPKYKKAPTFREFIEYVVELPINKLQAHWIPMYLQCMPCHIKYSTIARLDTLTRDSNQIFKLMGVSGQLSPTWPRVKLQTTLWPATTLRYQRTSLTSCLTSTSGTSYFSTIQLRNIKVLLGNRHC